MNLPASRYVPRTEADEQREGGKTGAAPRHTAAAAGLRVPASASLPPSLPCPPSDALPAIFSPPFPSLPLPSPPLPPIHLAISSVHRIHTYMHAASYLLPRHKSSKEHHQAGLDLHQQHSPGDQPRTRNHKSHAHQKRTRNHKSRAQQKRTRNHRSRAQQKRTKNHKSRAQQKRTRNHKSRAQQKPFPPRRALDSVIRATIVEIPSSELPRERAF
eukprot:355715-Chlamydomonas_euryale.AAC.3